MTGFDGSLRWVLAGALIGFGLVGFLTGLVLVPFGLLLAIRLLSRQAPGSGFLLVGIGSGPVVLLFDDLSDELTGVVPVFWTGVGLMLLGLLLAAIQFAHSEEPSGYPRM